MHSLSAEVPCAEKESAQEACLIISLINDDSDALNRTPADGDRVLDICCGTGSLLMELSKRTGYKWLAVGLDFSRGMLMVSKGKTGMGSNMSLAWIPTLVF